MTNVPQSLEGFIIGLAHIGHVVRDLKQEIENFKRVYGLSDNAITVVPPFIAEGEPETAETRFAFIKVADVEFELIQPLSDNFKNILLNMPSGLAGINHVAYQVSDVDQALAYLQQQGIKSGHVTPDGVVDFGPKKMLYLDPETTGGLVIELIEIKQVEASD